MNRNSVFVLNKDQMDNFLNDDEREPKEDCMKAECLAVFNALNTK